MDEKSKLLKFNLPDLALLKKNRFGYISAS